jgi:D-aminopeptidase
MRDPASGIDPKSEVEIEDTCRFLRGYMKSKTWRADPDVFACYCRRGIEEILASSLEDWVKNLAVYALLEQTKKRRGKGKPTRFYRNMAIGMAAIRLVLQHGYRRTRNDATEGDSASSIIHHALRRLGEKNLSEKSINMIIADYGVPADAAEAQGALFCVLAERPEIIGD